MRASGPRALQVQDRLHVARRATPGRGRPARSRRPLRVPGARGRVRGGRVPRSRPRARRPRRARVLDLERGAPVAGVDRDRESGLEVAQGRGVDQLAVDLGQRARVDADLEEAGPDARSPRCRGGTPRSSGWRAGGPTRRSVCRHAVAGGAVVAGVRQDLEAARLGEPPEQQRVAPDVGGCASTSDWQPRARSSFRWGSGDAEHLVSVVA